MRVPRISPVRRFPANLVRTASVLIFR
jgi:hypothetical protein